MNKNRLFKLHKVALGAALIGFGGLLGGPVISGPAIKENPINAAERVIKGLFNGIVPDFVNSVAKWTALGAGATIGWQITNFAENNSVITENSKNIGFKALGTAVISGLIWSQLRKCTPSSIAQQAKELTDEISSNILTSDNNIRYNTEALIAAQFAHKKYSYVEALTTLRNYAAKIYLILGKVNTALKYINQKQTDLKHKLEQNKYSLEFTQQIIGGHISFIEGSAIYKGQKKDLATDKSLAAQQLQAQAQNSLKNLAWISWFVHILEKICIDIPYKLGKTTTNIIYWLVA